MNTAPSPDITRTTLTVLIIGLLTFAIVVYVLMRYAWPRVEATFQARREAIEGGDDHAPEYRLDRLLQNAMPKRSLRSS